MSAYKYAEVGNLELLRKSTMDLHRIFLFSPYLAGAVKNPPMTEDKALELITNAGERELLAPAESFLPSHLRNIDWDDTHVAVAPCPHPRTADFVMQGVLPGIWWRRAICCPESDRDDAEMMGNPPLARTALLAIYRLTDDVRSVVAALPIRVTDRRYATAWEPDDSVEGTAW